jgi:hypothetical protein
MELKGLFQNRSFATFLIVMVFAFAISTALILIPFNGEPGKVIAKNIASVVFSLLTFWFFFKSWFFTETYDLSKGIWGLFTLGIFLWAVAEFVWAFFEVILKVETPFPSIADLFWVLGYIPLFWGLSIRYRTLDVTLDRQQKRSILMFSATLFLLIAYFVIRPILIEFDPQRLGENLLNLFYPLSDIVLLVLTCAILFSFGKGRFALTWKFIIFGFIMMSIADLLFSYLSWYGLYYPDGNINAISFLVDAGYNLSYILLALGIYAYGILLEIRNVIKLKANYGVLGGSKILIFTDSREKVISVSDNFMLLIGLQDKSMFMKRGLHELLEIDQGILDGLIHTLRHRGLISNYLIRASDIEAKQLFFTAIPLFNPQGGYDGAAIILQTELNEKEKETPLTEEQRGLVDFYLKMAGANAEQESLALKAYFLDQINLMYELVYEFNGQYLANSLLSFIAQKAKEKSWNVQINNLEISIPVDYDIQILSSMMSHLLRAGRTFTANIVSLALLDKEMKRIDQELRPEILQIVDQSGLRVMGQVAY